MVCKLTHDIVKDSIIENVAKLATNTGTFTSDYNILTPVNPEETDLHKEVINNINTSFQEQVIKPVLEESIISSKDRIIWGHPGIGKTFIRESRTDIIDFDSDYKPKINEKFKLAEGLSPRNEWRKNNPEDWNNIVRQLWKEAKAESKSTGKILVVSDMLMLREFPEDFDKIINISEKTFVERAKQRNDYTKGETENWKSNIDKTLSNIDSSRIYNTEGYFSDLFPKNTQLFEIKPSSNLVNEAFKVANKQEDVVTESSNYESVYTEDYLLSELGIPSDMSPVDFLKSIASDNTQVEKFLAANPTIKAEFSDVDSQFDPYTNTIFISLRELYPLAKRENIPFSEVVAIFTQHELAHAASYYALETGNNSDTVQTLYNRVKEYHKTNPFEDKLRGGYNSDGLPYSLKDIHEFVADAFSNPYFIEYLKSIPVEEESVWDKIVNYFRKIVGLGKKNSVYDKVVSYINSEKIQQDNAIGSETPVEQEFVLTYRGNPKNYIDAAYEFFTTDVAEKDVMEIFKSLPSAMVKLKKELDYSTNEKQIKQIQSLIDAYNEVKGSEKSIGVFINMLVTSISLANDLNNQMLAIDSMNDDTNKIHALYSVFLATKSLRFITPFIKDIILLSERNKYHDGPRRFITQLRQVLAIEASVNDKFVKMTTPAVKSYFASLNADSTLYSDLHNKLQQFEDKLKDPAITDSNKRYYERKVAELREEMLKIPTPYSFDKIFAGQYQDASMTQANLEAVIMNSHPLVQSVASRLRELDMELSQEMLAVENAHQKAFDKVIKDNKIGLREVDKVWEPILDIVKDVEEITEDENGKLVIKYVDRKMLLSSYSPEYLQKNLEYKKIREFYYDKFLEAKRKDDDVNEKKYFQLYQDTLKDQQKFQRENSELKYSLEVYDMFDMLDKEITKDDGTVTTFRKERGDIFQEIEQLEHKRDTSPTLEMQKEVQDEINQKYIKMREIRSLYTESGEEKKGFELQLAQVTNTYYELRNKYGNHILTKDGLASFEREKAYIQDRFERQLISAEQRDAQLNEITATEISPDFYEAYDQLMEYIADATEQLMGVPDIANVMAKVDKSKVKDGYSKIRKLTNAFRDNNGIIDGVLFSRIRPALVKQIRDIQQEVENLKNESSKLKGLSVKDSRRLSELVNLSKTSGLSSEEKSEMKALFDEKNSKKVLYANNKEIIDNYYALLAKLSALMKGSTTQHYLDEKDTQFNILLQEEREKLRSEISGLDSIEGGKYFKRNDKWFRFEYEQEDGEKFVFEIKDEPTYSAQEKVIDEVAKLRADKNLTTTDWWKNNHYTSYVWDNEIKEYLPEEKPIYIWVHTEPKDESFITRVPSFKFRTYSIKEEYQNKNFKEILPFIPVNKKGKFENKRFTDLQSASDKKNQSYKEYLNFIRNEYYKYQQLYPENKMMGDLLPGIVKTHDELKVEATNKALRLDTYKNMMNIGLSREDNQDSQLLTGGSQKQIDQSKRHAPVRFTSVVDAKEQSSNIPAMILTFALASKRYEKTSQVQPVFETLRTIVDELPVQETVSLASKMSIRNLWAAVKGENAKISRNKAVDKSNLAKTMDYLLDTFMYEQKRDEASSTILGMKVDWQKASSNLKSLASHSIFALNTFAAVKNTIAAKVQATINSNIGKGFFTKTDYAKANGEAVTHIKDFVKDYTKFGNKTFIGQALQYFQVFQGAVYNEYGRKTQWTALKDAGSALTMFKNISEAELQITQFLAMSRANLVEVDGKKVPFLQAFELDKEGNFSLKKGANLTGSQIKRFTKRIAYVNRMLNGAYREEEKNKLQKSVLGGLAFYLNGYVMPGIVNRFGGKRYSIEADIITRGYYSQAFAFAKELIKYRKGIQEQWSTMTVEERGRVLRFVKEISFIIGFIFLMKGMGADDEKKELEKNTAFYNYMLSVGMAVKSETETFIPLPGMGLNEFVRKANSPFAAMRQLTSIAKVIQNAVDLATNDEDAYYKRTSIKDGFHDKGDAKLIANFLKLIGWSGIQYSPLERVQNAQKNTQLK